MHPLDNLKKVPNSIWVGIINYKKSELNCEYLAIPYTSLTDIKQLSINSTNKLIGLEEHTTNLDKIWIGKYKGEDYIITNIIQIKEQKCILPYKQSINKKGIKIQLKGRLRGASKASTYKISVGNVQTHSFLNMIDYSEIPVQTRYGIFGLKLFLN